MQPTGNPPNNTKLISIFFPLKPLRNKFSDSFISMKIAEFIPKLAPFSEKVILYKIDKERFYTYDLKEEKFDNKFEVVDNQTLVVIFSVDKNENIDISNMFEEDFLKNVNTIRVHRKRIDPHPTKEVQKPSYIFFTINSTKLVNSLIPIIQEPDPENKSKTFFILSANNAKRDINPLERSFSTEKLCRINYISTISLNDSLSTEWVKSFKKKINLHIKN